MSKSAAAFLFCAHLLILTGPAFADVFVLANGGRIEARLLNPDQSPRETYVLRTSFGGRLTLEKAQVDRVVIKSDIERKYEARLPSLPDTAEAHWDMAQRCRQAKLPRQREFHLNQVVRLQPDHEEARHALGFSRIGGRWMLPDEWKESQGYERYRGSWRLRQEIELQDIVNEYESKILTWRKQLRVWRGWIVKGKERSGLAEREIRMLRDPNAAVALAEMLADPKENRRLKMLYVEVLGELPSGAAYSALTIQSLYNPDPRLREACLDQLSRIRPHSATETFVAALRHKNNVVVRRAAVGLAAMNDPTTTLPLIDALITEHKQQVGGGGIQPNFSDRGSALSMGGRPKIIKVPYKNDSVLHALSAMHSGVNFGYQQAAWKNWYITKLTPPPVNLRRGE